MTGGSDPEIPDPDREGVQITAKAAAQLRTAAELGDLDLFDQAVAQFAAVADATITDHPLRASRLTGLGVALSTRFHAAGDLDDLNRSIDAFAAAREVTAANDPARPMRLINLGGALRHRYHHTGDRADLDDAITVLRDAADLTPPDHREHTQRTLDVVAMLRERAETHSTTADLDEAVGLIKTLPRQSGDCEHRDELGHLSRLMRARAAATGQLPDLDTAIALGEGAVAMTPHGDFDRSIQLSNLGRAFQDRHEHTGAASDLHRATELFKEALTYLPDNHDHRAMFQSLLAHALLQTHQHYGAPDLLGRALELFSQALAATAPRSPSRAARLSNYGAAIASRFALSGSAADLDGAITLLEKAVALTADTARDRPVRVGNLAAALRDRFARAGALDDIDRAVALLEESLADGVVDPSRARRLSSLGSALRARYGRTTVFADLDRAIDVSAEALDLTPDNHPDRARRLTNLATALWTRARINRAPGDLEHAITLFTQALAATEPGARHRDRHLSNLASAVWARFELTAASENLDQAITLFGQVAEATEIDHPDRALRLSNLATALLDRYDITGTPSDLERAIATYRSSARTESGPAHDRLRAARVWARSARRHQDWNDAVLGYDTAIALAALFVPRELSRADQHFRIGELRALGTEAAATCLQAGQPHRAAELYEQGRAVLFSQTMAARSDLTEIAAAAPHLAARFVALRDELDGTPASLGPRVSDDLASIAALSTDSRRRAAAQFGEVLAEIRALPGCAGFLRPRTLAELQPAAAEGPVVLINIDTLRCDALILTSGDDVEVLSLHTDAQTVTANVLTYLQTIQDVQDRNAQRSSLEYTLTGVLEWLWDSIVSPVLDHLGYTATPAGAAPWPRVWWCPSGALTLLPIHAAGHHSVSGGAGRATIDRVVSTTVPTVGGILHARSQAARTAHRGVVLAMPHTPGHPDLTAAAREVEAVQHLLPSPTTVLGLPGGQPATHENLTSRLLTATTAHFACHAISDLHDPAASHLLLSDRALAVADLMRYHLSGAELAFLSACSTGRGGADLPDEPIHLGAACLLAGFRNVVATLWPIADTDAASVAQDFYAGIAATGVGTSAAALHRATRRLRAINRSAPSRWAAYVHTGP